MTRSYHIYRIWAIASSLLCAGLLAYIAASHLDAPVGDGDVPSLPPAGAPAELMLPEGSSALPTEWMSRALAPGPTAYSVRFDPAGTRELIVEQCTHRGYFDVAKHAPRSADWSFCETRLRGVIEAIEDPGFVVRRPDGALEIVPVGVLDDETPPQLVLGLAGETLLLVPGSRNDLFQWMEADPAIAAERDAMLGSMEPSATEGDEPTR